MSTKPSHSQSSATCSPIPDLVRAVVQDVAPNATVLGFEKMQTTSPLRRVSAVTISEAMGGKEDGEEEEEKNKARKRVLMVSLPPPPSTRILRSEQWLYGSEASIVKWLRDSLDNDGNHDGNSAQGRPNDRHDGNTKTKPSNLKDTSSMHQKVLRAVPRLHRHHCNGTASPMGAPYMVLSSLPGVSLNMVTGSMSVESKANIERQLGELMAEVADILSPNNRFGPAVAVLTPPDSERLLAGVEGMQYTGGAKSWKMAFHSYLESVLRDGEDMGVQLPYEQLRAQMRRMGGSLDRIRTPRLFFVDLGDDAVCVTKMEDSNERGEGAKVENNDSREKSSTPASLVGISNTSTAFFGDILLSTLFASESCPTKSFLRGFTAKKKKGSGDYEDRSEEVKVVDNSFKEIAADTADPSIWNKTRELVEDIDNAYPRVLLYRCLHVTAVLVREYYRPSLERRRREMTARKLLGNLLAKLEAVEIRDTVAAGETTAAVLGAAVAASWGTEGGSIPNFVTSGQRDAGMTMANAMAGVAGVPDFTAGATIRRNGMQRKPSGMVVSSAKRAKVD